MGALLVCSAGLGGVPAVDAQTLSTAPGPLEQLAHPISAANPIPARVLVVMPSRPLDVAVAGARALVTLRITLDASGSVAEVRSPCCGLIVRDVQLAASDAFIEAAIDAVTQWRYDPPADPPVSFDVTIAFRADGSSRIAADRAISGRLFDTYLRGASPSRAKPPVRTRYVPPVYPPEAMAAGLSGVVVLEARIDADGHIRQSRVVRSVPGLDEAALTAVLQWEYEVPVVNGVPAPILSDVTIEFTLPGTF